MTLLEQLQQLAPLGAQATARPWEVKTNGNTVQSHAIAGVCSGISPKTSNAAFIVAARNLLTPENVTLLVAALAPAPAQNSLIAFLLSSDTGMSSKAIAARYAGVAPQAGYFNFPYDSGDFGRCHRLLELVPGLDIAIMRGASATWDRLVAAWPALTTAYEALQAPNDYKHFRALIEAVLTPA